MKTQGVLNIANYNSIDNESSLGNRLPTARSHEMCFKL